ncbi:hypothetical protein C8A01DRAFT_17512, partial [Parachaetomium inaequale]
NSLKHLSWRNPRKHCSGCRDEDADSSPLKRVLLSQGSNLQSLEYRTDECDSRTPPVLSLEDLRALATLAPNLSSLVLHLERHDNGTRSCPSWPWEALELLAKSLPELTDLTIHFGLASKCHRQQHWLSLTIYYRCDTKCLGPDRYAQPLLNKTSAAEMARFLHQHKAGQPFKSMTFRAGDWTSPWHEPLIISRWLKGKQVWVTCRLANTPLGDQSGDNISEMVCDAGDTLTVDAYREWDEHCSAMGRDETWREEEYQEMLPKFDRCDGL